MAASLTLLVSLVLLGAAAKPQAREKRQAPVEFDECSSKTFDLGLYNDVTFSSSQQCRTADDGGYPNDANWNIAYVIPEGAKYVNIDFLVSIEDDDNCNYDVLTFGAGRAGDSVQLCGLQDGQFSLPLDEDESLFNVTFTSDYSVNADGIQYTIYFTDDFADFPTDNLPRFNGRSTPYNNDGDYFEESSNYDIDYSSAPWQQLSSYSYEPDTSYPYEFDSSYFYEPDSSYNYEPDSSYNYEPDSSYPYEFDSSYFYEPDSSYPYEPDSSYSYEFDTSYPYEFDSSYFYEPYSFYHEPDSSYSYEFDSSYSYEPDSFSRYYFSNADSFSSSYSYDSHGYSSAYSYEPYTFASPSYEAYTGRSDNLNDAPTPVTDSYYASSIDANSYSPPPIPTLDQSLGGNDVERITSVLGRLKTELAELRRRVEESQRSLYAFETYLYQFAEGLGDSNSDKPSGYSEVPISKK